MEELLSFGLLASSAATGAGVTNWEFFSPTGPRTSLLAFGGGTAVAHRDVSSQAVTAYSTALTTSLTAGGTAGAYRDITYANGIWHIAGTPNTHRIVFSTNGSTWGTALNLTSQTGDTNYTVGYGNGLWLSPVSGDNDVYTSASGTAFTLQSNVLASGQWTDVTWNGSVYGVYNSDSNYGQSAGGGTAYYTSTNGTTWTARTLPATPQSQVTAGSGVVMYVASGGVVYTSASGTAFSIAGTAPAALRLTGYRTLLEYGSGVWVYAGRQTGVGTVVLSYYSTNNGSTWGTATFSTPLTQNNYDLAFNSADNSFYMIADNSGTSSTDVYKASVTS